MTDSRLYITLNRQSEWQRALLCGLSARGNTVAADSGGTGALMITGSVDSGEHNFLWRNLLIDASLCSGTIMKLSAYAADSTIAQINGRVTELDSWLTDESVPAQERAQAADGLFKPLFSNCTDGLINMRGRYIWLKLEFIMLERRELELRRIKLLFRGEQMMDYLPEAYRVEDGENGFLSRYMSIYDGLFFGMDNAIADMSRSLDYRAAGGRMLRLLAGWVGIGNTAYMTDAQLRQRIEQSVQQRRLVGVKRGLIRWIESEYGVTPNIVEYFQVSRMIHEGKDREVYRRLFGNDPYRFFVLLPENTFADIHETNLFMERLKAGVPAHTHAQVVILRNSVILEDHTYLGVNSVIGGFSPANVDAGSRMAHDIILGGSENEQQ